MKPDIPRPWNAACWKFSRSFHLLCFHKSQNNWQILEDPCFYVSVICSVWKHLELQQKNDNVPPPWTLLITLYHQLENARTSNLQGDHLFQNATLKHRSSIPAILIKFRLTHNCDISAEGSFTTCGILLFSRWQARRERGAPDTRDGIRLPPSRVPRKGTI